jgi:hypothetical protein
MVQANLPFVLVSLAVEEKVCAAAHGRAALLSVKSRG